MINRNTRALSAKRQKGMTLIEFGIVIAIAAVVMMLMFAALRLVNQKRAVSADIQNFTMLASELRTKFGGASGFDGLSPATLVRLGVVPEKMVRGMEIINGFSNIVDVASTNIHGAANDGFVFTTTVPSRACSDFVAGIADAYAKVDIAGTTVRNTAAGDGDITPAELSLCDATAGGGSAPVAIGLTSGR